MFRERAHQEQFARHGYVLVDLLDEARVRALREAWRQLDGGVGRLAFSVTAMSPDARYRRRVHELIVSALAAPLEAHLQDHRVLVGLFINKARAFSEGIVELHQDWTFVDEARYQSLNVWCPLVDVDELNGCLFVVPGSHRLHSKPRPAHGKTRPFSYERLLPVLGEYVRPCPMKAGQALLFSNGLFHGSGPNLLAEERPVASCIAIPSESQPRLYLEVQEEGRTELSLREAALDVLLDHYVGVSLAHSTRPLGRVPLDLTEPTEEQVRSVLEAGRAA